MIFKEELLEKVAISLMEVDVLIFLLFLELLVIIYIFLENCPVLQCFQIHSNRLRKLGCYGSPYFLLICRYFLNYILLYEESVLPACFLD